MALTARHVAPGERYVARRNVDGRLTAEVRRMPASHRGIVCEACDYTVRIPTRLGVFYAEGLRRQHLARHHHDELIAGTVVLTPPEVYEARLRKLERAVFSPSINDAVVAAHAARE